MSKRPTQAAMDPIDELRLYLCSLRSLGVRTEVIRHSGQVWIQFLDERARYHFSEALLTQRIRQVTSVETGLSLWLVSRSSAGLPIDLHADS